MNKHDAKYLTTSNKANAQIEQVYDDLAKEVAYLAAAKSGEIVFSKEPLLSKQVDELIKGARIKITLIIQSTTSEVWGLSNKKNDEIVKDKFTKVEAPKTYTQRNEEALKLFQERKVKKFKVSERVWNYTSTLKADLQNAINVAIKEGKPAAQMAREIRQYLNEPNNLGYTMIRQGNPGQGVYRSSVKNSERLCRNEINKAYRKADWLRWQQMDFVIGYRIQPSSRAFSVCKLCTSLAGIYPKNFVFTNWHVACRCVCLPIMISDSDFDIMQQKIMNGEEVGNYRQPPIPGEFADYYKSVKSKIGDNAPDWYADNVKILKRI